jgi:hypothetical protein
MLLLLYGETFGPKRKKKAVVNKCSIEVGMHTTCTSENWKKKPTHTHTYTKQKFLFDNFWALGDKKKSSVLV